MPYDTFQNITLQQLEALLHLVSERSFSRAASRMCLTQPSLTKHIQKLEEAIGSRVVHRENPGITLTPEGKVVFDLARKTLALREEAKTRIIRLQNPEAGVIHLCASTIPATYILPQILAAFTKSHPGIHTHLVSTNSDEAIEMVLAGACAIGFVGKPPESRKLSGTPLGHDRLILVLPRSFPQASVFSISPTALFQIPFIIREKGSATRETLDRYLREQDGRTISDMNVVAELGSSEAIKEGIIAGLGASVLSAYAVAREIRQGIVSAIPIEGWNIERDLFLVHRKKLVITPPIQTFLDFVSTFPIAG